MQAVTAIVCFTALTTMFINRGEIVLSVHSKHYVIQNKIVLTKTSVLSNLAIGRIADLSPLAAANRFVRSLLPSNTWFGPT